MNRNRVIQIIALVAMAICLVAAGLMTAPITLEGRKTEVHVPMEQGDSLPPQVALTSAALGSFRGVLVNTLWYRANELKDAGKFYEANALAEATTTLQPHMIQVWSFMSWNMAYNISVETNTLPERWDWVNKGIMLLRDKGIQYNPRSVRLYRELSWIFFHKIGQFTDDAQWYYKSQLATEWQEILGAPNEGATSEEVVEAFKPIVEAPDRLPLVVQAHPDVQLILDRLKKINLEPDEATLRQIGKVAMFNYSPDAKLLHLKIETTPIGVTPGLPAILQDPKLADAMEPFLAYLRRKVIKDHYHMDPQEMLNLLKDFGPLDWRMPAAHGHYWADMGTTLVNEHINPSDSDLLNTYRLRLHSVQDLMRYGRLVFDPISGHIDILPDLRFVDTYEKVLELAKEQVVRTGQPSNIGNSYDAGYENFLLQSICFSYLYGDEAKAQKYYDKIRTVFGSDPKDVAKYQHYQQPLEDIVTKELQEDIGTSPLTSSARQFIDAMIDRAIRQGLFNGDRVIFARFISIAKRYHEQFQSKASITPINQQQARMKLLPFEDVLEDTYIAILRSNQYRAVDLARIWYNTPPELREATYGRLRDIFILHAQGSGFDPDIAFPAPPGWKAPPVVQTQPDANSPAHIQRH